MDLSELHEMFFEFLAGQFEIKSSNEYLALRIGEFYAVFGIVATTHAILLHHLYVGVWLLDMLAIVGHHEVIVIVVTSVMATLVTAATSHLAALASALMIVSRFDINAFIENAVTFGRLVLSNDASLDILCFIFVVEAKQDKAEATASLSHLLSHHNRVFYLTKLGKIVLKVLLRS